MNETKIDDAFVERMGHVRALLRKRAEEDAFTLLEWQRSPVGERGAGGWNVSIHFREGEI